MDEQSTMDVQSTMSADTYTGILNGINVFWTQRAIQKLPKNAQSYGVDMNILKATTEKVAVALCATNRKENCSSTSNLLVILQSLRTKAIGLGKCFSNNCTILQPSVCPSNGKRRG